MTGPQQDPFASWAPPTPAGPTLPPASVAGPVAGPDEQQVVAVGPELPAHRRSRGAKIGAGVGVGALVAAGVFAFTTISGNDSAGGAATPEEVGTSLTAALDNEDVLGVIDLLLPGERDAFREPMIEMIDNLRRLEVLSDKASLSSIGGLDIVFTDVTVRDESTSAADITNIYMSGSSTVSVNGDELPLGDLLLDLGFDGERPDIDQESQTEEFEDIKMTVVERDGRWYLSAFYTAAEAARDDAELELPDSGIKAVGADEPEGAVDNMLSAVSDLNLKAMIAVLDPTEAEVLQRYAPMFLDDAQQELDDAGLEWSISETSYSVSGSGDRRTVFVDALTFELISAPDTDTTVKFVIADGCAIATIDGNETKWCGTDKEISSALEDFGIGDPEATKRFFEVVTEAFADLEPQGIAVHEVNGQWYVSPLRTNFDIYNGVLAALDSDEIRDLVDSGTEFVDTLFGSFGEFEDPFIDDPMTDDTTVDEPMTDDDTMTDEDVGVDIDAFSACYELLEPAEAIKCFNEGIAAGTINPLFVSAQFRFPECGVAELYWSDVFTMSDAEFVAMAEKASPCFLALVADGTLSDYEVPGELFAPECLEGLNWYSSYDEDYNTRFNDCVTVAREAAAG